MKEYVKQLLDGGVHLCIETDEQGLNWIFAPENCNLNNFVWVFLLILSGVLRLSVKYGLSRFLLSSCCHANNDIIHANCRFSIDFVKEITSTL